VTAIKAIKYHIFSIKIWPKCCKLYFRFFRPDQAALPLMGIHMTMQLMRLS
jgi:hypothetical protein